MLTIDDITRRVEVSSRRDVLLQSLTEGTRASLANIRAAIETMLEYPEMSHERHNQFTRIIRDETIALSAQLDTIVRESAEYLKTEWPLEEMLGSDLISAIQRRCEHTLDIAVKTEALEESLWLKLDSYSVTQALTYVLRRLKTDYGISNSLLNLQKAGRFAQLDLIWNGALLDTGTLRAWENQPLLTDGHGSPLTLKEVAERHGGEVWYQADKATQTAYLRLLLPLTQPEPVRFQPVAEESRPEYYDFDLFHQPGQTPEIDQRRLTELTYTVFDTETTGLRPSEGDEIVSIGP